MVMGLMTITAAAQTGGVDVAWFARGTFGDPALDYNGGTTLSPWDDLSYEMDFIGGNHYKVTVGSTDPFSAHALFSNARYEFKIGDQDYNPSMPGSNGAVYTNDIGDGLGQITFHLYDQTSWSDGWFPNNTRRVGYDDSGFVDWEVVGTINDPDWPAGAGEFPLTDMGSGLHSATYTFNPGSYQFKFRKVADWGYSTGNDFGNSAGNISFTILGSEARDVTFSLDLPNGRWRADIEAPPQDGDYNLDGNVDTADYVTWAKDPANHGGSPGYDTWKQNYSEGTGPLRWVAISNSAGQQDLAFQGGTLYTAHYSGLTPGSDHEFQVIRSDQSVTVPGSPVKVRANASGEIDLNFNELIPLGWEDGWGPNNEHRLGYEDSQQYGWGIVGDFTTPTWPAENDPAYYLTDPEEDGVHTGTFTFATPGTYHYKYRHITADQMADPAWSTSIGTHFGNNAPDIEFTVTDPGETWTFELDLPNGRSRAFEVLEAGGGGSVPEPASLLLVVMGLAAFGATRRR
jgi:hypothetical protein